MKETIETIDSLRKQIDQLDREIVERLQQRADLAIRIGVQKGTNAIYVPEREHQVLENVVQAGQSGPLRAEDLRAIYREVLSACRALERPTRVAYLGPEHTFTHQAATTQFGQAATFLPARSVDEVFLQVEKGNADYGVVPMENSTEGGVTPTLDSFVRYLDTSIRICAEIALPVSHHLVSPSPLEAIKVVYSHPQALAQCRRWLSEHVPHAETQEVVSTAAAVARVKQEPGAAAIGSELAAAAEGVPVVARNIQDQVDNVTRFVVLGKRLPEPTGNDRTALLFSVVDRPGALYHALGIFAKHSINLTFILSRPSRRRSWDYYFFVDLEGHPAVEPVAIALEELQRECALVKVLGAWRVAERPHSK